MPLHSKLGLKRSIVIPILVSLLTTMLPVAPMVQAIEAQGVARPGGGLEEIKNVQDVDTIYGLVAILVDEATYEAETSGQGLFSLFGSQPLADAIETYAEDVQSTLPWTKAQVITVSADDTTPDIQRLLEKLYYEGDGEDTSQLTGVVVIGEGVPLPVVNKNGNRFLSMLPYTDFEDASYVLDETTLDFVPNDDAQNKQAEVWHGLIVPPLDGQAGYDLLGAYFEKNHAFHSGDENYTTFDEKVFVGDFVTEASTINSVSFGSYQRFLDIWEEIAFYQYSSDLLERLVLDMTADVEEGDGLDNDLDGSTDEEALNGKDDDGDGLIDEDLGDGFFNIDNDEDGLVDEDGMEDNNNDRNLTMNFRGVDGIIDHRLDEDPPGDANGDGCPGVCGVDDSGYASDHDGDGYPTGIEVVFGFDWQDGTVPHRTIGHELDELMDEYDPYLEFNSDAEAIEWAERQFTDGFFKRHYIHESCIINGVEHPEYDDDEDGFCDEDGSTEIVNGCAYNDGDCDGLIDEDPRGLEPSSQFDGLPDIQSKSVIDTLISRYTDLFEQPQGVWNRLVNQTGRYSTQSLNEEGNAVNDYDTAISLIAKKDEFTLQYLDQVNRELERELSTLVENHLQEEIPLVGAMEIFVEYYDEEDSAWREGCAPDAFNNNLGRNSCVQFVNHTLAKDSATKSYRQITNDVGDDINDIFINGQPFGEIERVYQCSNAAGTYSSDGGQIVDFNLMYSFDDTSHIDTREEYEAVSNCTPDMLQMKDDLPYICDPVLVEAPIRTYTGASMPGFDEVLQKEEEWERGFGACYEFRELSTFGEYKNANGDFNDWIASKVRKLRRDDGDDPDATYADFLNKAYDKMADFGTGTVPAKKSFDELDLFQKESGMTYTVTDMFRDLGLDYDEDEMDLFMGLDRIVEIDNPRFGSGLDEVDGLRIHLKKAYFDDDSSAFTEDIDEARMISSVYKHTHPWRQVLNDQMEAVSVPNLPIDKLRRISFYDGNADREEVFLSYINLFDAENFADVEAMFDGLASDIAAVNGGASYQNDVNGWLNNLNTYQLEDAVNWMNMNVDQKHAYVLDSYLGLNEPLIGKTRNGYELVSIVADGTATELYGAFNGDKPESEGDLEWQYRHQDAIDLALAASSSDPVAEAGDLGGIPNYDPVPLSRWLGSIQNWFDTLSDSVSAFDMTGGGGHCSMPASSFARSEDTAATAFLQVSRDDQNHLVTVTAHKEDGSLNKLDSLTRVELRVLSGGNKVEVVGSSQLTLTGGVATFSLQGKELGDYVLDALAVGSSIGDSEDLAGTVDSQMIATQDFVLGDILETGAAEKVELYSASSVMPAGAESVANVRVEIKDAYGNLANNGFHQVTLMADAQMELLDLYDEDKDIEGIQVTTPDGYLDFRVLASPEIGTGTVTARVTDVLDSTTSLAFEHLASIELEVVPADDIMFAGTAGEQFLTVMAKDDLGRTIVGLQGEVTVNVNDPRVGSFGENTIVLTDGVGSARFVVGQEAGNILVTADGAGLQGGSASIDVKPAPTYELRVRTADGATELDAGSVQNFIIEGFDQFGNLATTDSSTTGALRLTESTNNYGQLSSDTFTLNQGVASFSMNVADVSGQLNLVAQSGDLLAGTWGGAVNYSISGADFADIEPQMLYASVLGAPFGDVTQDNYIGGWLTFNGKTQAVTSLLSEPTPKARRAGVDAEGNIMLPDGSLVSMTALGANGDLPMRFQWHEYPSDSVMAEVIYAFPSNVGIQAELLTQSNRLSLDGDGEWLLRDQSAVAVKVREDGQIQINDPLYTMAVADTGDGLGVIVSRGTEQVMLVTYDANWSVDVASVGSDFDLRDWDGLTAGIYVKPSAAVENDMVSIPTGNNSLAPMGMAIVNPDMEVPENQRANMGYSSLELAEEDGTIGWENDNKHLLLYAAGNTVGDSNLYYASEVGVVLGDPTVKLTSRGELNDLYFTSDLGRQVYASQSEPLDMISMDYNGDGREDVLLAYPDGNIELMQSVKGPRPLVSHGTLLTVENGIRSVATGDFNGDDLEDLLVVTESSCFAEEMCLYIYENIGGGFVAQNLTLDELGAKPVQVVAEDLNGDSYTDLILADENMVLSVAWNNGGTIEDVDTIKNFGLYADATENLEADVLLRWDGMEGGTSSLPMLTTEYVTPGTDADLSAFVSDLALDGDFELLIDGVSAGGDTVTRMSNFEFRSADENDRVAALKRITDGTGGNVEVGDTIYVDIRLENQTGSDLTGVYISDLVTGMYDYVDGSFSCEDCLPRHGRPEVQEDYSGVRPWIFGPLTMDAGEVVNIQYHMEARALPELKIMVGQDLQTDYVDDDFADIGVSLDGNTSGQLMVYYSDGFERAGAPGSGFLGLGGRTYKKINYSQEKYSPLTHSAEYEDAAVDSNPMLADRNEDGTPDIVADLQEGRGIPVPSPGNQDPAKEILGAADLDGDGYYTVDELYQDNSDVDGDGINDTIDNWVMGSNLMVDPALQLAAYADRNTNPDLNDSNRQINSIGEALASFDGDLTEITTAVENVISTFSCNGGCIAMPGSIAFLVPGYFHDPLFGTQLAMDHGLPIFGITGDLPPAPPVCVGPQCYLSRVMRMYLAPTTTLGLGFAVCLGSYPGGKCFAFSLPVMDSLGVCDAVNGFIADSLSKASDFVSGNGSGVFNTSAQDQATVASSTPSGLRSSLFTEYQAPVATDQNVQVPGFPSVFTEWWKAQKLEFFKMLDLPDVTFKYPSGASIAREFTEIEEVTSGGVFQMEDILNYAHALPLVDIKPEPVTINYPAVTSEEVEAFEFEVRAWKNDTLNEVNRFLGQFCLVRNDGGLAKKDNCVSDELSDEEREVLDAFSSSVDGLLNAVEANLDVIESYGDVPRQILELRNLQSHYAKVIVCYLDVILGQTAGYLSDNVQRMEAWMQWMVDMTSIVEGWKLLIDLSADFMDSCDKCTNQRYSGFQFLFSLFVFIPDLPVITLPKLPDIVIDVSHITAGVDIIWPDLKFQPTPVQFPQLPRIVLPTTRINTDFDLDLALNLPSLPVLPTFSVDYQVPELPELLLPELPSIPAPPAVPEIFPEIKSALEITGNILKVVCLIRSGFVPTDESMLKTRVEEITQRPAGLLIPADLRESFEWPGFEREYLERIEVDTYLNLQADFSPLFDMVEGIADDNNAFLDESVSGVNSALQDMVRQIETVIQSPGDIDVQVDVEADVDVNVDLTMAHPAMDAAQQYKDSPMVKNQLLALTSSMTNLQSAIDEWSAELPEGDYELVASQSVIAMDDPRLHNYDAHEPLDARFLAQIQDSPLAPLATMRDSLIAYVDDMDRSQSRLEGLDGLAFHQYLAQENVEPHVMLASTEDDGSVSSADAWNPVELASEDPMEVQLASQFSGSAGLDYGSQPYSVNDGLYIFNEQEGVRTKLVDYDQESDENVKLLFIDVDEDGDEDVLYTLGGDVFLKENHFDRPDRRIMTSAIAVSSVNELAPAHGAVKGVKTGKNAHEAASFSMDADPNASAYEVFFYDSMEAMVGSPDENLKRLLLLADESNPRVSEDVDMRQSRILVANTVGRAELFNGYGRTPLGANAEIQTAKDVVLQALTDTRISIRKSGETKSFVLPAGYQVDLRRDVNRVVRIESGDAIWIDFDSTADNMEIIEGMALFPGEEIQVAGFISRADIVTSEGVVIELNRDERFMIDSLMNPMNPNAQLEIENGAYYTRMRALYNDGTAGTLSDNILLNPQICGDDSAPYPIIGDGNGTVDVAIFNTTELSAENSFDSQSAIHTAEWDLDSSVDSDEDGDTENDVDATGLSVLIGPYDNLDPKEAILTLTDEAGNAASARVDINVYVPEIAIEEAMTTEVHGAVNPGLDAFPFTLVRERDGAVNEIGDYSTDALGDFDLTEFEVNDLINVYNEGRMVVAQFNPVTRQVLVQHPQYDVAVIAAGNGWPAHLSVFNTVTGVVAGSFIIVSEDSRGITVSEPELDKLNLIGEQGVTVHFHVDEDQYEVTDQRITARDANGHIDVQLNADGNIKIYDPARYQLVKRDADSLEEAMIIELYDRGELELEIWVGGPAGASIKTTEELGLKASSLLGGSGNLSADLRLYFEDLSADDTLYEDILELVERGILEGQEIGDKRYFMPNKEINRAEFAKIILSILCIVPDADSKLEPHVFNDVLNEEDWFFPYTKEAFKNGLITGYLGELDGNGQAPFKPGNTITRAEATKIVIEALEQQGVIENLPDTEGASPWFGPYIEIAKDLSPYLVADSTQGDELFILTEAEATDPGHIMTRYEFVEMSVRVLQAHNCFDLDSDSDGLINFDEESLYGTDPYNPDTDAGGVADGTEVNRGTDPLNEHDDFSDRQLVNLEAGVYGITEPCNSCPCLGNLDWDTELRVGDLIFAIIRNDAGTVFGISNKEQIEQ